MDERHEMQAVWFFVLWGVLSALAVVFAAFGLLGLTAWVCGLEGMKC